MYRLYKFCSIACKFTRNWVKLVKYCQYWILNCSQKFHEGLECCMYSRAYKDNYAIISKFESRGNTACRPTAAAGRDRASVWIYDRCELLKTFGNCSRGRRMKSTTSNETGGRDFPTFDIYCGPALDPSYLCSLNSFRIVSAEKTWTPRWKVQMRMHHCWIDSLQPQSNSAYRL